MQTVKARSIKSFLSGIFAVIVCVSLHAAEAVESGIFYGNADVVGKEYVFDGSIEANKSIQQTQNAQAQTKQAENTKSEIASSDSSCIYIAENAEVYGKELLFVKQDNPSLSRAERKATKIRKEAPAPPPVENEITEQEPISVFPVFPFAPSSLLYLQGDDELAVILQQRPGEQQPAAKTCRECICQGINNLGLSLYLPKQRQKLSIAATQCGELTSFGSQSPPAFMLCRNNG